jgi:curved DNA-binding protein CbpA
MVATEDAVAIPFYLMPIAAVLGSYVIFGACRILYIVYANATYKKERDSNSNSMSAPTSLLSRNFLTWIITVIVAMILYAKIVAQVEYAMTLSEYAHFDPYEILGLESSSITSVDISEVKAAYRRLAKEHHPDKSAGDSRLFQRIHTAYRALTTDKDSYEQYGHPDGPISQQTLSFALPGWLLQPTGPVAAILLILYLAMFIGLIYIVITWLSPTHQSSFRSLATDSTTDSAAVSSLDAAADTVYLAKTLGPESTHMHVLWAIATTPETVALTQRMLDKIDALRRESVLQKQKKASEDANKAFFAIEDEGWADDNEDLEDEATKRAKEEEALKEQQKQQLAEATGGAAAAPMEGVDEGVLGQLWVERTLERFGQWPPTKAVWPCLEDKIFMYRGKAVAALEHPAVRRNLCFTMGRLNSIVLNTHTELCKCILLF